MGPSAFKHQNYGHWYDPSNWRGQRWRSKLASPVPHAQQVPCRYDTAVFLPQTIPKLAISDFPVDISQVKINQINLNSGQFRSISTGGDGDFNREIGQMLFQLNQSLTIYKDNCPHLDEGCVCDEKNGENREKFICSMTGAKCPDLAACSSALKPIGHCCYNICGAIINVQKPWDNIDVPFNLVEAKNDIETLLQPAPTKSGISYKSNFSKIFFFCILRVILSRPPQRL